MGLVSTKSFVLTDAPTPGAGLSFQLGSCSRARSRHSYNQSARTFGSRTLSVSLIQI